MKLFFVEFRNGLTPIKAKEMIDWRWVDVPAEGSLDVWEVLTLHRNEDDMRFYWCDSLGFEHLSEQPVGVPPENLELRKLLNAFGEHCRTVYGHGDPNADDYIGKGLPSELALAFDSYKRLLQT